MASRVDNVAVILDVYQEFEGRSIVSFAYVPEPGDPIVAMLLAKNDEMNLTAARAAVPAEGLLG